MFNLSTFAQQTVNFDTNSGAEAGAVAGGAAAGFAIGIFLFLFAIILILSLVIVISMGKIFAKAGESWWKALIPIYNVFVILKIVKRPEWLIVFYLLPTVSWAIPDSTIASLLALPTLVVGIIITFDLAKAFNRGGGFAIGMILLPLIFYPILAFGKSEYAHAAVNKNGPVPPTATTGGQAQAPSGQPVDPASGAASAGPAAATAAGAGVGVAASQSQDAQATPPQPPNPPKEPETTQPQPPENPQEPDSTTGEEANLQPTPEETQTPSGDDSLQPDSGTTDNPDQQGDEDKTQSGDSTPPTDPGQTMGPSL